MVLIKEIFIFLCMCLFPTIKAEACMSHAGQANNFLVNVECELVWPRQETKFIRSKNINEGKER